MSTTNTLVPKPRRELATQARALTKDLFPGLQLFARPQRAFPHGRIALHVQADVALAAYEALFSINGEPLGSWRPADKAMEWSCGKPGTRAAATCQLRRDGVVSHMVACEIEVLEQCTSTPGPSAPRKIDFLKDGAMALISQDGVARWHPMTGDWYHQRISLNMESAVVSPEGLVAARVLVPGSDDEGRQLLVYETRLHNLPSGQLLATLPLEQNEILRGFAPQGELITEWRRASASLGAIYGGREVPLAQTPHHTRLWNVKGREATTRPGVLLAISGGGCAAIGYFQHCTFDFFDSYHGNRLKGRYEGYTFMRGSNQLWVLLSPNTGFAAIKQAVNQFKDIYKIVRVASGWEQGQLPEYFRPQAFVSEDLIWGIETTPNGQSVLLVRDWMEDRVVRKLNVLDNVVIEGVTYRPQLAGLHFGAADPENPSCVALRLEGPHQELRIGAYVGADDYQCLRLLPHSWLPLEPRGMIALGQKVYVNREGNLHEHRDVEIFSATTGVRAGKLPWNAAWAHESCSTYWQLRSSGSITMWAESAGGQIWGRDEAQDMAIHWTRSDRPQGAIVDVDARGNVLMQSTMDHKTVEQKRQLQEHQRRASQQFNAMFGAILSGEPLPTASSIEPLVESYPPDTICFTIWNYQTGATAEALLNVPTSAEVQVVNLPQRGQWLVLALYLENRPEITDANQQPRRVFTFLVRPDGNLSPVASHLAYPYTDPRCGDRVCRTAVTLARCNPGQLLRYDLESIVITDAVSGQIIWECPNPMARRYGTPNKIAALPDGIWAEFSAGSIVVDRDGRIREGSVHPSGWEPTVFPTALIYQHQGTWQPLVK